MTTTYKDIIVTLLFIFKLLLSFIIFFIAPVFIFIVFLADLPIKGDYLLENENLYVRIYKTKRLGAIPFTEITANSTFVIISEDSTFVNAKIIYKYDDLDTDPAAWGESCGQNHIHYLYFNKFISNDILLCASDSFSKIIPDFYEINSVYLKHWKLNEDNNFEITQNDIKHIENDGRMFSIISIKNGSIKKVFDNIDGR